MQTQVNGRFIAFNVGADDSLFALKRRFEPHETFVFLAFDAWE
ncbi:MAG: hypothetical protein U0X93_03960 [Anaerolineales bacterium]